MRRDRNPLLTLISIRRPPIVTNNIVLDDADLRRTMPTYIIVGTYLAGILKHEIIDNTVPKVFNSYENASAIIQAF